MSESTEPVTLDPTTEVTSPGAGAEPVIEVRNLSRWFPGVHAVQDVSFTVERGQVVGFVGANGAGKTTTMRILATLDYPTSGEAKICGYDVVKYPAEVRKRIGWMPDHYGTYSNMTVLEYLDFFARALGYRGAERIERITEVMEFTDLTGLADRLIDQLSKGMGQRLCLGRALIHDPDVLILDEPAAGLDPKARIELKHLIRVLSEEGKTVFISSHILSELGEMCDSLLFINHGKIIHHGSAESLRRGTSASSIVEVQLAHSNERLAEWASMAPNVRFKEATRSGGRIEIDSIEPEIIATVLRRLVNEGLPVTDFHLQERKLEDAFIEILGEIEASGIPIAS
ncbi:MAG TPA: ABC transporter ATP-binding protein [Verrucomicrobiales bacterium]|jgi:ABC-2 type transport system ATP-binding protein|nr:ABC transporter ATP-binding protein [Verrucomicrobiales bacterium]